MMDTPALLPIGSPPPPDSPHHSDDGLLGMPPAADTVPIPVKHAPEVSTLRRASTGADEGIASAGFSPPAAAAAARRNPLSRMSAAPAVNRPSPPTSLGRPGVTAAAPRPSLSRASCPVSNQNPPRIALSRQSANGHTAQPRQGLTRSSLRRNSVIRTGEHRQSCYLCWLTG